LAGEKKGRPGTGPKSQIPVRKKNHRTVKQTRVKKNYMKSTGRSKMGLQNGKKKKRGEKNRAMRHLNIKREDKKRQDTMWKSHLEGRTGRERPPSKA